MNKDLGGNGRVSAREYKGRLIQNVPRLLALCFCLLRSYDPGEKPNA